MNIEWKRVTWYSQLIAIILFLDIFAVGMWLGTQIEVVRGAAQQYGATSAAKAQPVQTAPPGSVITAVSYTCDAGKTIEAVYKEGSVNLSLSDGRSENLLQSISADGGRYTNSDESFVFWSKGTGAFITEGSKTTFDNCEQVKDSGGQ
jgi:membrane-bound inhibitor of C-type lysozyme